jgi:hypothetical protein
MTSKERLAEVCLLLALGLVHGLQRWSEGKRDDVAGGIITSAASVR